MNVLKSAEMLSLATLLSETPHPSGFEEVILFQNCIFLLTLSFITLLLRKTRQPGIVRHPHPITGLTVKKPRTTGSQYDNGVCVPHATFFIKELSGISTE
jgi:hypothetical protein